MKTFTAASWRHLSAWLALSMLVIGLDQASKLSALQSLDYGIVKPITAFFNLVLIYNHGAAFSFLSQAGGWQRWLFSVLGLVAAVVIIVMLAKHQTNRRFCFALALILGGAIGNVIDRIAYGYVIDFLDLYIRQWDWHVFNIFNVADCAISIGAVILVIDELLRSKKTHPA